MSKPSKELMDFMAQYNVDSDEVWEVHGSTWVVKHKALERVAAEQKIAWDRPAMIETNSKDGIVAICVFGTLGDRTEWSIGEATPKNNENQYPYAMAEKRAKDRVILKLLNAHGTVYSDAEADEFVQPAPKPAPKKDARQDYANIENEIRETTSIVELDAWGAANADRIKKQPTDWQRDLRAAFKEQRAALTERDDYNDAKRMAV